MFNYVIFESLLSSVISVQFRGGVKMADELWRQCAKWLVRCDILPADHKVMWPLSQVFDFAQILRDGVLLCQLANKLLANCIDVKEISNRPQMSQVCKLIIMKI